MCYSVTITASLSPIADLANVSLSPGAQERDWRMRWTQAQEELARLVATHTEPLSGDAINAAASRLHAFFIQAYHIKDSLKADTSSGVASKDVENAINSEPDLALLADLANLDKHFKLTTTPRSGSVPQIKSVQGCSTMNGWQLQMTIEHNGGNRDGLDVAQKAVAAWQSVLRGWGLI